MIKIIKAKIQRYRSIMDMTLDFDSSYNIVSISGRNNVGKTNTLRAINLFFNPSDYDKQLDIPEFKNATWGGSVHPKITLDILDDDENYLYCISRDLKAEYDENNKGLSGYKKKYKSREKREQLASSQIENFLKKIEFIYIESINLIVPDLISEISENVISLEYDRTRFTSSKQALKDGYLGYVNGLQSILDEFGNKISGVFKEFRDNWTVKFEVPKNAEKFRDLISDDVSLSLDDMGSIGIDDKGSGLQRLALLLLQFEVIDRLKSKKSPIIFIDEPDLYLHEGLQKKLRDFLNDKAVSIQIFYTTHSRVFINTYKMKNVFLLDAEGSLVVCKVSPISGGGTISKN
jgi:predicted ATP-dependent endonuclease of OLD family